MIKSIITLFIIALMMGLVATPGLQAEIRVTSPEADARIEKDNRGVWFLRQNSDRYSLEHTGAGRYVFKKGSSLHAQGTMKGNKITLYSDSGSVYVAVKFKAEKIKISPDGGPNPYEFKFKSDKIKLVMGGVNQGKIKYYPNTGKLKAKDRTGNTRAEMKGLSHLSAAAGIYLMTSLPADKRACLVLFMLMMGK